MQTFRVWAPRPKLVELAISSQRIPMTRQPDDWWTVEASSLGGQRLQQRRGLEVVAQAGATAVIQPGGSVRDPEVIAAADRLGIAMAFTGMRHFRHG